MRKNVVYHPDVEPELVDAVGYYERQCDSLGARFLNDFDRTLTEIVQHPDAWPSVDGEYRRHQLRHFPHGIIYRVLPDAIRVLALMHLHRHPDYWKVRQ